MGIPSGLALLPDAVRAMLATGETPQAWELAHQLPGGTLDHGESRSGPLVSIDPSPVVPFEHVTGDVDRMHELMGGMQADAWSGSLAERVQQAMQHSPLHVLLTDRRLALVVEESQGVVTLETAWRPLLSIERRHVQTIVHDPRLMQRGRVRVTFADGSWSMLMLGMVRRTAADRLVAAFAGAR